MREILFSDVLQNEYSLVSVLSCRNDQQLVRYRNKKLDRDLVIRIVSSDADLSVYKRLCGISQENLVQIYDIVEESDKSYILEEFVDGISLCDLTPVNATGAENVLVGLCLGIKTLHSLGIIHKDIKEDNVIVTNSGIVKLVDFNISKVYKEDKACDTNFLGTVTYAPPEQFGISKTNFSSDIYTLGILINTILTGKHPAAEIYSKGRLGKFIAKATNINIDRRFQTVDEVLKMFI